MSKRVAIRDRSRHISPCFHRRRLLSLALLLTLLGLAPGFAAAGTLDAPNTIQAGPLSASPAAGALSATFSGVATTGVEVLATGFGQVRAGAPVSVGALLRNNGATTDLVPISITVYDAEGTVVAAGDTLLHYIPAGETTGLVHRLTASGAGAAVRVTVQTGAGRPASDPLPGTLQFGAATLASAHGGLQASTTLTSSYTTDLSNVHINALVYDATGTIIGGGETIKRLVPAAGTVGVLANVAVSGSPARVDFYAQLP